LQQINNALCILLAMGRKSIYDSSFIRYVDVRKVYHCRTLLLVNEDFISVPWQQHRL
jgi:hypothetical protein